jgi:hypothetical protein
MPLPSSGVGEYAKQEKREHQAGIKQSLIYSSTLRMRATFFPETLVDFEGNA